MRKSVKKILYSQIRHIGHRVDLNEEKIKIIWNEPLKDLPK